MSDSWIEELMDSRKFKASTLLRVNKMESRVSVYPSPRPQLGVAQTSAFGNSEALRDGRTEMHEQSRNVVRISDIHFRIVAPSPSRSSVYPAPGAPFQSFIAADRRPEEFRSGEFKKTNPIGLSSDGSIRYTDSGQNKPKPSIFHAINWIQ